jgi:hypothetical protein
MMVLFSLTGTSLGAAEPAALKFRFKTLSGWNRVGKISLANQNMDYPARSNSSRAVWTINPSQSKYVRVSWEISYKIVAWLRF